MILTAELLVQAGLAEPATAAKVAASLAEACERFGIDTPLRMAGFLAQCSHESCGFRVTKENLNYGAQALLSVFPKYFNAGEAAAYARQQERIANRIYANRMGNGPEASGDGWKHRGRGFIQLTGKNNYRAFSEAIENPSILENPDVVAEPEFAALSAAWFWSKNGLNQLADAKDIVAMTKRINGGTIGLDQRTKLYEKALKVFAIE